MYDIGIGLGIIFLLLATVPLSFFLLNKIMGKLLKDEKKEVFSKKYVNKKHEKIDWTIRFTTMFIMLLAVIINFKISPINMTWYLQPWFYLFVLIIVTEIVRLIMEYKYAENRNAYKFTASQLVYLLILIAIGFKTSFFGLLKDM